MSATDIIPIMSVAIGDASLQVQTILSLTAGGITFWLGLELRRPDSPTGRFIAGLNGPAGSSAWVTPHECPRSVIAEIDGPEGDAIRDQKIPTINAMEKAVSRKARESRTEWSRARYNGRSGREEKEVITHYRELHRLIRIARVHRVNATLRGHPQGILRG